MGKKIGIWTAAILLGALALSSAAACGTGAGEPQAQGGSSAATSDAAGSIQGSSAAVSADSSPSAPGDYASVLFDDSFVHKINISISEEDWADLLANPLDKTKYHANATIDGETIEDVSFATKGNTSLSAVAEDEGSNRYSFKVSFGKYVDGQTYHGLDKLNLSNTYADATYMKDYLSYRLFRELGVESPLVSYVWLKINGEDFGLYAAIEEVGDSYLARTKNGEGELYKPESDILAEMDKARTGAAMLQPGGGQQAALPSGAPEGSSPDAPEDSTSERPEGSAPEGPGPQQNDGPAPGEGPGGGAPDAANQAPDAANQAPGAPGGFDDSTSAASLAYIDDNLDSYSEIFDYAETDASEEDEQRVVAALKALSEGDCERALDTSEVIRYFAAHNFVLNYDSYTGNMLHNYYLYEKDGKLAMLPWDYNLAFNTFSGGPGSPGSPGAPTNPGEGGPSGGNPVGPGEGGPGGGNPDGGNPDGGAPVGPSEGSPNGGGPVGPNEGGPVGPDGGAGPAAPSSGDATSLANTGIDSPLSQTAESARPMWAWIAENDQYLAQYHDALDELVARYFESGAFESEIDALREMLLPYVQKDPSAFYSAEEFEQACSTLKQFCLIRAQSIRAQLDGSLAPVTADQASDSQISAAGINVDDMGAQRMG